MADQVAQKRRQSAEQELEEKENKNIFVSNFPLLWGFTDLDVSSNWWLLVLIRLLQAIFLTNTMVHPDEYWQSTQPAYRQVYGDELDVWLPWEWSDKFRLRNCLYPMYLALPMQICKDLGIDTNMVVRITPYLAHLPVVLLNDWFTWKVAKRVTTRDAARLGFIFYFFNRFETMHLIRTLTNSIEQMFTVVAFYYYLDQKDKFTMNTVILTALISIAFMMRNTSPVGWIPLLAIKVFREGSLLPFIISGLFVALPILFACVYIDTKMY